MTVKVRIAPSPTGNLHVGTAQSALFNWLFARKNGGQFFLRIEDTNTERSKREFETNITEGLTWLGLDWDNTQIQRQSERTAVYREHLQRLLDSGQAFWRQYSPEEKAAIAKEGRDARDQVIVLKDEGDPQRELTFNDIIRGPVTVQAKQVGQLVIAKSLDEPLFHFAVVVDDIAMEISHVIRGEDHISNTPKQMLIYAALEAPLPQFAHLPLLLDTDRSKLSKRKGAVSIAEYQKEYLPEALLNFLGALSYTFDPEMLTREEMVQQFELSKVHKSGALFDLKKLNWFNAQYIKHLPVARFKELVGHPDIPDVAVPQITERLERLTDVASFSYFWEEPAYAAQLLSWKGMSVEDTRGALEALEKLSRQEGPLSEAGLEALVASRFPGNRGAVYWPLRVALSGREKSAGPLEIATAIGPARVTSRLEEAVRKLS